MRCFLSAPPRSVVEVVIVYGLSETYLSCYIVILQQEEMNSIVLNAATQHVKDFLKIICLVILQQEENDGSMPILSPRSTCSPKGVQTEKKENHGDCLAPTDK